MHNNLENMDNRKVLLERVDKWLSQIYWTDVNITSALFSAVSVAYDLSVYEPPDIERPLFSTLPPPFTFQKTHIGSSFGPSWSSKWFRLRITNLKKVEGTCYGLKWDSNSEAQLYSSAGKHIQAFTGGCGHDRRDLCIITDMIAVEEDYIELYLEMACNEMFGNAVGGMIKPPDPNRSFTLASCELVIINIQAHKLYWDVKVVYDLISNLPENDPTATRYLAIVTGIINSVNLSSIESIEASSYLCDNIFGRNVRCSVNTATEAIQADTSFDVFCVGHCHIDTAWLWPYAETRRKIARFIIFNILL